MSTPGDLGAGGQADMQLAAAALLADNKDVKMMLRVLGKTLQDAFGDRVEVVYHSGGLLHHQSEEIKSITVELGPDEYQAQLDGRSVRCVVGRTSGGIRIRNEELPTEQWLGRLLDALQKEAVNNQSARAALQNVIIGGSI
jgi:intracellular sulfur oxidation DsrE/DsrF family protein